MGDGAFYFIVQFATVLLLVLAANTSFGGLPSLLRLLATDHFLPHRFAHRSAHDVYRWGVLTLSALAAALLVGAGGRMNTLVPLFAIGVFVGFTLAQVGLVLHWHAELPGRWVRRALPNMLGAAATAIAAAVTLAMKFEDGAWLIVVAITLLVPVMTAVRRQYGAQELEDRLADAPALPLPVRDPIALVPVKGVDEIARRALQTAMSMSRHVRALHVSDVHDREGTDALMAAWDRWEVGVPLVLLDGDVGDVAGPIADYVSTGLEGREVLVVIGEPQRDGLWELALSDESADRIAQRLAGIPQVTLCRQVEPSP